MERAALLRNKATRQIYTYSRQTVTDTVSDYVIVFGIGYAQYRGKGRDCQAVF